MYGSSELINKVVLTRDSYTEVDFVIEDTKNNIVDLNNFQKYSIMIKEDLRNPDENAVINLYADPDSDLLNGVLTFKFKNNLTKPLDNKKYFYSINIYNDENQRIIVDRGEIYFKDDV